MVPAKREREEKEEDNASLNVSVLTLSSFTIYFLFQEDDGGQEEVECPEQTMTEGPVDFTTVKCEEEEQTKEEMDGVQPDMSDMAAFIASATAAVRNAGGNSFQVISTVPPSQPPSTALNSPR